MSDRPGQIAILDDTYTVIGWASAFIDPGAIWDNGRVRLTGSPGGGGTDAISYKGASDPSAVEFNYLAGVTSAIQTQLNLKAPLSSPAFTGTPTAPTAAAGTNTTQLSTTAFVQTAIANLIDSSPGTLDTLNELAAALGDDPNFAATTATALGNRLRIDTNAQGLNSTQQGNGRTNLGLGTSSVLNVPASGNAATGEVVKGSDTRLTDARTPTAHAASHAAGGSDPVTLSQSQITNLSTDLAAKQPLDDTLTAFAGLSITANVLPYGSGADAFSTTPLTAFARTLLDDANQAAMQTTLALVPGTNVQAYDAELAAIAGLTGAADKGVYFTGPGAAALYDLSSFARTLLDDTTQGAAKTTLGLGTGDSPQFTGLTLTGNLSAAGVASSLIPSVTDTYDLGSSTKLWRKGWLSEIDAVLFAKNTVTLVGGWLRATKNEGAIPVGQDVGAGDTTIDFGQSMTVGDFVEFRAAGSVEYVQVGTLSSGTRYNVTRNLDGSGANTWPAGSVYAVNGSDGNGRIDINANSTPRISLIKQGATYNAQTELVRVGDLNGWGAYASETYGFVAGEYAAGKTWVSVDPTNGYRIGLHNVVTGQWDSTGATFGSTSGGNMRWDNSSGQLQFRGGATVQAYIDSAGAFRSVSGALTIDLNGVRLDGASGNAYALTDGTNDTVRLTGGYDPTFLNAKLLAGGSLGGANRAVRLDLEANAPTALKDASLTLKSVSASYGTVTLGVTSGAGGAYVFTLSPVQINDGSPPAAGYALDVNGDARVNGVVNAVTGYRYNGAATTGNVLRGNGTNFVSAQLAAADLSNGVMGTGAVVLATSPTLSALTVTGGLTVDSGTLYVDATNNRVGINFGTADPKNALHVYGNHSVKATASYRINVYYDPGPVADKLFELGYAADFFQDNATGDFIFRNTSASAAAGATVTMQNRLGLKANGTVRIYGLGAGTLNTNASGEISATSDERLKDVKGKFIDGLSALLKLDPISFEWKHERAARDEAKRPLPPGLEKQERERRERERERLNGLAPERFVYHGFSAQNVREAIPGAVGENEDGTLTVQERALVAVLVNAVKELAGEVSAMKKLLPQTQKG